MELVADLDILHLHPDTIGLVKEGPVKRYLTGKAEWDSRFLKAYEQVQKARESHLAKSVREESERILKRVAKDKSKVKSSSSPSTKSELSPDLVSQNTGSNVEGIWELHGEKPPPSSIAARKDTKEARSLAAVLDTHYEKMHALHLWNEVSAISYQPIANPSASESDANSLLNEIFPQVAGVAHPHRGATLR